MHFTFHAGANQQSTGFPNAAVAYAGLVPPSTAGSPGVGGTVLREVVQIYGSVADDTVQTWGTIDDEE